MISLVTIFIWTNATHFKLAPNIKLLNLLLKKKEVDMSRREEGVCSIKPKESETNASVQSLL